MANRIKPAPPQRWPSRRPVAIQAQAHVSPKCGGKLTETTDSGNGGRWRRLPTQCGVSRAKYIDSSGGDVVRLYIRPRKSPGATWRISSRLSA